MCAIAFEDKAEALAQFYQERDSPCIQKKKTNGLKIVIKSFPLKCHRVYSQNYYKGLMFLGSGEMRAALKIHISTGLRNAATTKRNSWPDVSFAAQL